MLRVVGIGNPFRGDDAAGPEAVRRLRSRAAAGVEVRECAADPASLLEAFAGAARVVVVDAMASGEPPGTVARFDAILRPLPAEGWRGGTHGLGVAEAVELGRVLGALPASLEVVGIEGACWDHGAPLSPEVDEALDREIERLVTAG
jgi:hydrogenase maturation protease